jgi:hypothetical protein
MLPARTSHTLWTPSLTLWRAIKNAITNARIITIELFVRKTIMVHMEKAIAEWPDGMPPLKGVPL